MLGSINEYVKETKMMDFQDHSFYHGIITFHVYLSV